MRDMWSYIHARTVVRAMTRLRGPVPDNTAELQRFLRRVIDARESFSILQIGAYDGVSNDSVHELLRTCENTRAVLLEPQPGPYATLQALWRDIPRVTTLRCALGDTPGERSLYVIAEAHRHRHPFPDQVASFLRSQVEFAYSRYVWRPSPSAITSVTVPVVDWGTLVQKHGPFDLVAIDAEGYDAEILKQIDSTTPPAVILYEHRCLSSNVQRDCEHLLTGRGYSVRRVNSADTVASRVGSPGF